MGLAVHGSILYPIMGDRCTPARGPMDMEDAEGCRGTPEAVERAKRPTAALGVLHILAIIAVML